MASSKALIVAATLKMQQHPNVLHQYYSVVAAKVHIILYVFATSITSQPQTDFNVINVLRLGMHLAPGKIIFFLLILTLNLCE